MFSSNLFCNENEDVPKPKLLLALTITGVLIGPFMSFAGVFNEGAFFVTHLVFAVGAYFFVLATAFCWGIYVKALDSDHVYKRFKIWYLDLAVIVIIIGCIIAYAIAMIFFDHIIWNNLGIMEKVTIYSFFVFFITILVRILIIVNKQQNCNEILSP